MIESSEQQIINRIADRLVGVYPTVAPEDVSRVVHDQYSRFDGRPVRDFVPLFVERSANAELTKIG